MCQASIILKQDDTNQVVLENAAHLEVTDQGVWVAALFDPPKLVPGTRILSIDFLGGKVILTRKDTNA